MRFAERIQTDIAIVGYACRWPGARNADEFWRLLDEGRSAVAPMPEERWRLALQYDPDVSRVWADRPPSGGFLTEIDQFDPTFFRMSPVEATQLDPRARLFLEMGYRALEHAGYGGTALRGSRTGVFVGCGASDYFMACRPIA